MNRVALVSAAALAVLALSGCGTITRGTSENWVVSTTPPGAMVRLSTGQTCTTPCALTLPRKQPFIARLTRDGYEPVDATVGSGIGGGGAAAYAGNVFVGGIIGVAIDAGTGANMELSPNPLNVALVPLPQSPAPLTAYRQVAPPQPVPAWAPAPPPITTPAWSPAPPPTPASTAARARAWGPTQSSAPSPAPASIDYSVPPEVRARPMWWHNS